MDCFWIKITPSLNRGVAIINKLDENKFEQFLRRIVTKMKIKDVEIFTEEEKQKLTHIFKIDDESLLLAIKTVIYLYRRMLKYIFMPNNLKNDLNQVGFGNEKSELLVKVWSAETRTTLSELGTETIKHEDSLNFSWKLNAELSSDFCKKSKTPKAYISISGDTHSEMELTHPELHSMFLQFEAIQNELDNLI